MQSPEENDAGPQAKKLKQTDLMQFKQARLPFVALDQKQTQIPGSTPPGSKKRKLSDGESPSAKPPKTHKSVVIEKPSIVENDPEVSSSSEAENVPLQNLKSRVRNTLERFVRKNSHEEITSTKDEISSTIDCVDLTDSNDGIKDEEKSSDKTIEKEEKEENKENECQKEDEVNDKQEKVLEDRSNEDRGEEEVGTSSMEVDDGEKDSKSDGNTSVSDTDRKRNISEVSTGSVEEEFTTPAKQRLQTSLITTPSSETKTPISPDSLDNSQSDATPKSSKTKTPRRLSDVQKKEKEIMRQRIKEQKEKEREEKKKQKEQERLAKEAEREKQKKEREDAKAEKEKQKKEAQEKREKDRQEKQQQKEEEKRKKQEIIDAKQEEKRKKEEEKKQKEEEKRKEEEEKKMKEMKVKESFTNFFIKSKTSPVSKPSKSSSGLFMPFELKKDMFLAPEKREQLDEDAKSQLDSLIQSQDHDTLYLRQLKDKQISPHRIGKTQTKNETADVVLVHDSESVKKVTYHCKLLQFHMNYRPPYYGTWRKKSKVLTPRNPFKTDSDLFDYEVDSDDEWEEEEPGESLSASEGEEEKDENSDDEEEDGWMVPHGYLSEGEGCDDDEEITPEVMKARQKARADQWESELKRQTQPVLPIIIGCFWEHAVHSLQKEVEEKLKDYKGVSLQGEQIQTSYSGAKSEKGSSSNGNGDKDDTSKVNPQIKPVPEEAMPDLIRLVHGNLAGIKKLIKEFRMFWKMKTCKDKGELEISADVSMEEEGSKTEVMDISAKTDVEMMEQEKTEKNNSNFTISKRQLEIKINAIAIREKREPFKKICWYVHDAVMKQYNMPELPVPSTWEFVSQPAKTPNKPKVEEQPNSGRKTPTVSITQFAKPMSPSARQAQFAAANAAALAEKQKAMEAAAALVERQKMAEEPMDVASSPAQKNDQKSIKDFAKGSTPTRHHEWKMTPTGSEGKRLVLVSQSPTTKSNTDKAIEAGATPTSTKYGGTVTTPAKSNQQALPRSMFQSPGGETSKAPLTNSSSGGLKPLNSPSTGFKPLNSPSAGLKPLNSPTAGLKSLQSPQQSSGTKKRIIPIPVVDGKPKPSSVQVKPLATAQKSKENEVMDATGTGENSMDAIVLD
ncbi:hypothetical protein FSP39_006117 [Pinctada imbricata]|uniref:Chromatin assembly factor 1 subunit A n=1 Tax=Pinctada imbricata TaxID=66713 RepID=A0AA88Y2Y7_PINIB|nr:hypothetical protein FSP39_006117 [Pinctada imbricata]